jgi:hypothetical protein
LYLVSHKHILASYSHFPLRLWDGILLSSLSCTPFWLTDWVTGATGTFCFNLEYCLNIAYNFTSHNFNSH